MNYNVLRREIQCSGVFCVFQGRGCRALRGGEEAPENPGASSGKFRLFGKNGSHFWAKMTARLTLFSISIYNYGLCQKSDSES